MTALARRICSSPDGPALGVACSRTAMTGSALCLPHACADAATRLWWRVSLNRMAYGSPKVETAPQGATLPIGHLPVTDAQGLPNCSECGGEPIRCFFGAYEESPAYFIQCNGCQSEGPGADTPTQAAALWVEANTQETPQ